MKKILHCLIALTLLVSYSGYSMTINLIPPGVYSYTQKGEELIDGQKASITWNINMKNNQSAVVTISSWHAPFTCDGSYTISNEKDYVSLSWARNINIETECELSAPQIFMKKSPSGEVLIRSELFLWGNKDWHSARKIH